MRRLVAPLLLLFIVASCTPQASNKVFEINGKTMGTTYSIKLTAQPSLDTQTLQKAVDKVLVEVNRQMSTYQSDSEISQVNQAKAQAPVIISDWFGKTLQLSLQLAQKTSGAFDPTIGPLVNLWGFGPNKHKSPPSQDKIEAMKKIVGYQKISLQKNSEGQWTLQKNHPETYIDLSASAKGFGVDQVSELLMEKGFKNHLVEIGGELKSRGHKLSEPWRVAIEKPTPTQRSIQEVLALENASLATSGSYRNFFESQGKTFPHIIDSQSGQPVKSHLLSVSVVRPTCAEADALSTALFVMGHEKALKYAEDNNIAALFILAGQSDQSPQTQVVASTAFSKIRGDQ